MLRKTYDRQNVHYGQTSQQAGNSVKRMGSGRVDVKIMGPDPPTSPLRWKPPQNWKQCTRLFCWVFVRFQFQNFPVILARPLFESFLLRAHLEDLSQAAEFVPIDYCLSLFEFAYFPRSQLISNIHQPPGYLTSPKVKHIPRSFKLGICASNRTRPLSLAI